ncbi:YchJ family metal-binding protein [Malaciobacter mytili]|uniref:YchJ family protein n=1 Tax=Malaciobacter mytili TaxID=603050 RepID=UPI001D183EC1|nr:YchJ family metal-binding protein [Malaciobacter mytili]
MSLKLAVNSQCICGSKKKYKKCCKLFHDGENPPTALDLMRSRFSAFASHNADYIIKTTHYDNPEFTLNTKAWLSDIYNFCEYTDFNALKILEFIDGKNESFVTFKAVLSQNGLDASFTEKSRFLKVDGKWYYVDGIFL